jgi:transketolase N-terminal domain/subunit
LTVSASTKSVRWRSMRSKRRNPAILALMGMAPVAYGLWQKRLNFDPASPTWPNRDRFILSAGHASMLLYALLHLTKTQAVNAESRRSAGLR